MRTESRPHRLQLPRPAPLLSSQFSPSATPYRTPARADLRTGLHLPNCSCPELCAIDHENT